MHFFVGQILAIGTEFILSNDDSHHLIHALRARIGEKVTAADGNGRSFACTFIRVEDGRAVLSVDGEICQSRELPVPVTLFQSLPKSDKMTMIIQKATELGVSRIVPVLSARAVSRPDRKAADKKAGRWQKVAEAAAKQCGRDRIPEVSGIISFDRAVEMAGKCGTFLLPYECADDRVMTRDVFKTLHQSKSIAVMIGPEGGFEASEAEQAVNFGAIPVTLGKRILRTETAAVSALSMIVYRLEIDID